MRTLIIRNSHPTDAESIEAVRPAACHTGFQGLLPCPFLAAQQADALGRAKLVESRQSQAGVDLVCVVNHEIVGWLSGGATRDADLLRTATREIYACYVHPIHWRRGIARGLLHAALQTLEQGAIVGTTAWVISNNVRMHALLSSLGFSADGAQRSFDAGMPVSMVRVLRSRFPHSDRP